MNQKDLKMAVMHHLNKLTEDHATCMNYVLDKTYFKRLIRRFNDLHEKQEDLTLDDVEDAQKLYNISERCYYIAQDILKVTRSKQS